jgi:ABC-type multidrug transport system fused ATPase/permease subunit
MMLRFLFTRRDRAILLLLTLLMVLSGLLEVFGLGMLFPYVQILQDPTRISDVRYVRVLYEWLGFSSHSSFLIAMSMALLVTFLVKGVVTIWVTNFQLRFVNAKLADLGSTLLSRYLHQPYAFFLSTNTSVLIGNLTTSITQLCQGVIQSALLLASEATVTAGVVVFLIYLKPVFSLSAILFLGGLSVLFRSVIRVRVGRYAHANEHHWKAMLRCVNEGLSSAKEVQVLGCQRYFVDAYSVEVRSFGWANRCNGVLAQLPRVALESAAVAGIVTFGLFAILAGSFGSDVLAVLAAFAIATIRIVPSTNRMLQAWNGITFYRPSIEIIAAGLSEGVNDGASQAAEQPTPIVSRLPLREGLMASIKSFAYPTNPHFGLVDIDLTIRRGQTVGLIGQSGSGKTTLVDLILGLFPHFDGSITVDGYDIRDNLAAWRQQIGYIPQSIYLRDDTIVRNVAFGVPDSRIDMRKVERAICLAGLEPVIRTQREGLETLVGDRGVRLSGGERQRIGIARALYHDPDLLVLDEATSALDNETEQQIIDSILGLSRAKTVIIIAHRLSTVKYCDMVYLMRSGRIIDRGPFSIIAERNPDFVNPQFVTSVRDR